MTMTSANGAARGVDATLFGTTPIISIDGSRLSSIESSRILSTDVSSVINRPDLCEIRLLHESDSQGTAAQALPTKFKLGAALKIEVPAGSAKVTIFEGEITSVDFSGSNHGPTEVLLVGYDKRHRLYRGDKSEVLKDKTVEEILKPAISSAGLSLKGIGLPRMTIPYYLRTGSAGELLDTMCARYGLMAMSDGADVVVADSAEWSAVVDTLDATSTMLDYRFRSTSDSDPIDGKTTVRGWDPKKKEAIVADTSRSGGLPQSVEQVKKASFGDAPVLVTPYVADKQEATAVSLSVARQNQDAGMQMDATCTLLPKLRAGKVVEVKAVPAPFAGKYRLTSVRHVFDLEEGGRTMVMCRGSDDPTIAGLLASASDGPGANGPPGLGRNGDWALRPAIVCDIKGDGGKGSLGNMAEVKVKLPWLGDDIESNWIRVVSLGAGADRGWLIMPEVNDEVLVAFNGGDHRSGFVIGGLWNGKDKMPRPIGDWEGGGKVNQRVLRSRTGQEIVISDKDGDEHILIQSADKKMFLKIEKKGDLISIGGKDVKLTNTGKTTIESDGEISVKSKADLKMEGQNITIKAQMALNLEAGTQATLKGSAGAEVSGAKVDVKGSGPTTVKGNPIMLN